MFITKRYIDGFLHVSMKTGGIILRPQETRDGYLWIWYEVVKQKVNLNNQEKQHINT